MKIFDLLDTWVNKTTVFQFILFNIALLIILWMLAIIACKILGY